MGYARTNRHRSKLWAMGCTILIAAVCVIAAQQIAGGNPDPKPSPLFAHSLRTSVENFDRFGAVPRTRVASEAAVQSSQMIRPVAGKGDGPLYRRPRSGLQNVAPAPMSVRTKPSPEDLHRLTDEPVTAVQASVPLFAPGALCDGEWQGGATYYLANWFEGNETYAVYQDPDQMLPNSFGYCPSSLSNYVFAVTEIHWFIYVHSAITLDLQPLVFDADPANPTCPVPASGPVLCEGPVLEVNFPGPGWYGLSLPFDMDCCPLDPFFAGVYVPAYLGFGVVEIVIDDCITPGPVGCRGYNDFGYNWVDLVNDVGFPGNVELFCEGYSRASLLSQRIAAVDNAEPASQTLQGDRVVVQSTTVEPGQTDVTVEISIENTSDLGAFAIPLIARSISGDAYWEGNVDTLPGHGRLTSALTDARVFNTDAPTTPSQVLLTYMQTSSPCLTAGPLEGMTGLVFDVNGNTGEFEIDTAFFPPAGTLSFVECGTGGAATPEFTKGTVTIAYNVVMYTSQNATCYGEVTCNGNTCPGSVSCPGTTTCPPISSCAEVTCEGSETCPPMPTCEGTETCLRTVTCFPATTCAGMSTCPTDPTASGMPSCTNWYTCPEPCGYETMPGAPTCIEFYTCPDWPTCFVNCPTYEGVPCLTYDTPTQCGAQTCPPYPTCSDDEATCHGEAQCSDILVTSGSMPCETKACSAAPPSEPTPDAAVVVGSAQPMLGLYPVVFSVDGPDNPAEGLLQPDPSGGHPIPNDVYALRTWVRGLRTEGELFQSSGWPLGDPPNATNVDRMSGALGFASAAGGPYMGPFAPNPGAAVAEMPIPCNGGRTLGIMPGDNVNALSFGLDAGNVLMFSVDPGAVGLRGSDVYHQANVSAISVIPPMGSFPPSNGGGDPGGEAAGDLYVSNWFANFGDAVPQITLAPALPGMNQLAVDEILLGLQAPARTYGIAPEEDDLDALEADDGARVDGDFDGIPDMGAPVYFSLNPQSTTVIQLTPDPYPSVATQPDPDGVTPDDILMSPPPGPGGPMEFAIFARGIKDIGLMAGDDLDALCLDESGDHVLIPAQDAALFSLAMGSPSLAPGANPSMPGPGPFSPGDVFMTEFPGQYGPIYLYASAAALGLTFNDELDALDIGMCSCDWDIDTTDIGDICEIGYTHWGSEIQIVLAEYLRVTFDLVYRPGRTLYGIVYPGPPPPVGYTVVPVPSSGPSAANAKVATPVLPSAASKTTAYAYNLGTSACYAGPITVCFGYDESQLTGPEGSVRLLEYQEVAPGDTEWVDVTVSLDTDSNEVCGDVDSLYKTYFLVVESPCVCTCHGDPVCDGVINVLDVVTAVDEAFRSAPSIVDPACSHDPGGRCDVNCDGVINVLDVVYMVNWAFRGNPWAPCDPCLCTPYPTNCVFPPE